MTEVAVVIPCFNLGRFVEEAIDSALQQTRSVAEIIVVDDGSTDLYTRQILTQLRRPKVQVIHTKNGGVSKARNHGIALSSAQYVVLLDADDLLEPTYVEKMAGCLDEKPEVDFVSCALQAFEGANYRWMPQVDLVSGIVRGSVHISTLFRRRVFEAIGGFDSSLPAFEPADFWICAMERGFKGYVLSEPLLRYRIRTDSRYHKAISADNFAAAREALLRKHSATVERHMVEILAVTDSFLVELGTHHSHMKSRRETLFTELEALRRKHAALAGELARRDLERIDWGDFRTATPLGDPTSSAIRRYCTNRFLAAHRSDMRGRVLSDDIETVQWLGERITEVTLLADDAGVQLIPTAENVYDCVLLTELRGNLNQVRTLLSRVAHALRPGGVFLCVFSSIEPFQTRTDDSRDWRFTESAARALLLESFSLESFETESMGNVKMCAAALHGLTADQLDAETLNRNDPWFPLLTCARALKPIAGTAPVVRSGKAPGTRPNARGAVLMYHRIAAVPSDERRLALSPAHFRAHMEHIRRYYHPISLEEMARTARDGSLPDRAIAVTLDDGYLDALTTAAPILAELGIPATFFINTMDLDQKNEFWGDTLERIFFEEPVLPPEIEVDLAGRPITMLTRTFEERRAAWRIIAGAFYPLPAAARAALLQTVVQWSGLSLVPRATHRRMLSNEVVSLAAYASQTIGAHTTHHLDLTAHGPEIQKQEMVGNKTYLERLLGRPVLTFAYPYGIHDSSVVDIARAVPFVCAVTVMPGLIGVGTDVLRLPRLEVPLTDVTVFREFLDQAFI